MGKKSKNTELGRALARKQKQKSQNRHAYNTSNAEIAAAVGRHTIQGASRNNLVSVLDASDLEELMANATLANQSFVAERCAQPLAPQSVIVVTPGTENITPQKEELNKKELRIPRRPAWTSDMTFTELMRNEEESFLTWRRGIATLENESNLGLSVMGTLTPFEKNLDVWRQLWRVVERSDMVLQIVDARNPYLYYCEDLVRFVEKEMKRKHILVMNKADLLSSNMLNIWDDHFKQRGINVIFFSAFAESVGQATHDQRVVNAKSLIEILEKTERRNVPNRNDDGRAVIGLCGYPNVGKSSTINVLLEAAAAMQNTDDDDTVGTSEDHENDDDDDDDGNIDSDDSDAQYSKTNDFEIESVISKSVDSNTKSKKDKEVKRVAVSATPGKTKHFQTLALTETVMLCDCPGLVFPNFAASKSELICAGVLSIDTMRGDYESPVSLICKRIPSSILSAVYGITFDTDSLSTSYVTADALLDTHARARGFMTDHGRPDRSRSARTILKDFVTGRLVFVHHPNRNSSSNSDSNDTGEAGIGAAVFAKKGKLVYQRMEAAQEAQTKAAERKLEIGDGILPEGQEELLNEKDATKCNTNTSGGGNEVKAFVSGKRKQGGRDGRKGTQEFVRVRRTYDSSAAER